MRLQLVAMIALALVGASVARAEYLKVLETGPAANAVISAPSDGFFVRFNQSVDHVFLRLIVKRGPTS